MLMLINGCTIIITTKIEQYFDDKWSKEYINTDPDTSKTTRTTTTTITTITTYETYFNLFLLAVRQI